MYSLRMTLQVRVILHLFCDVIPCTHKAHNVVSVLVIDKYKFIAHLNLSDQWLNNTYGSDCHCNKSVMKNNDR